MSETSQKSTNPADYQRVPRAVAAMPKDFPQDFIIEPHSHERAQLIFATAGTMRVVTGPAMWIVPPQRALWMPAGVVHGIEMLDRVGSRNVIFETDYPHQDGTWPYSREQAAEQFGHLDQALIDGIARGNAIRLLGLQL